MDINTIERNRKFNFFTVSFAFAIGLLMIFLVINTMNRAFFLIVFDLLLIAVMTAIYIALRTFKSHMIVYRVGMAIGTAGFLYLATEGGEAYNLLYSLFFIPLLLFFFFSKKEGLFWCTAFFLTLSFILLVPVFHFTYDPINAMYCLVPMLAVIIVAYQIESSRKQYANMFIEEQLKLTKEKEFLAKALEEIKILNGLLPICSFCKKIRDDKGYWEQIENYIRSHSEAEFSHSICPDCAKKHYAEFLDK